MKLSCPALPGSFTLTVIRHAQTSANLDGTFCGLSDVPLTPLGIAMAQRLARNSLVAPAPLLWCSPFRRAQRTAETLGHDLGINDIKTDSRLAELSFGEWEGKTKAEVAHEQDYHLWQQDPYLNRPRGGETGAEALARLLDFLTDAMQRSDNLIVVTHKTPSRLLAAHFSGHPLRKFRALAGFHVSAVTRITRHANQAVNVDGPSVDHLPEPWQHDPDQLTIQATKIRQSDDQTS